MNDLAKARQHIAELALKITTLKRHLCNLQYVVGIGRKAGLKLTHVEQGWVDDAEKEIGEGG